MGHCNHNELTKMQPSYTGIDVTTKDENTVMPQPIMYSPYVCKECGKQYSVLQAIVGEIQRAQEIFLCGPQ